MPRALILALLSFLTLAAPAAAFQKVAPAAVGLDAHVLDQLASAAKTGKSNCLLVLRDGKLAGEWYFRGTGANTTQDVYSATKSFTSTLVGMAGIDPAAPADTWIPQWAPTPSAAVTVKDLLSMDSGRQWSLESDYAQLPKAPDQTAFATGLGQQQPPGIVWTYNNAAVQTLEPILRAKTGEPVATYARERLFEPLGMSHTEMTTDKAGHALMYEGVHSTCRDMARFGEALLEHGKGVIPKTWIAQATKTSSKLNAAYGYLFWLNHKGTLAGPFGSAKQGQVAPKASTDLFWALGLGNQLIQVDPHTKTVVVRLGTAEPHPQPPTFGPVDASKVVTEAITH